MLRVLKKGLALLLLLFVGLMVWPSWSELWGGGDYLVVIDPGHGGSAPGAVYEGVMEKDLNLSVALQVRDLLQLEEGIQVLMTRDSDQDVGLYERSDLANKNGANLFVSIHANALEGDTSFKGIFTFYHRRNRGGEALASTIQQAVARETGGLDRGIRHEDYVVVRETKAPACLLEMGFMTNSLELERLKDQAYQAQIAGGIRDGILAYWKEEG